MRIFILSLLIALLPAISFGQDYEPLLKEGKWWNYSYDNVFSNNFDYLSVGIGEDVSIDGITYKSIYDLRYPGSYIYAMREEDKKVYSVLPWDETPQLIYDFGKNAGEIVSEEIDNNIKTIVKVISIDSVVYRDHILRRMLVAKEYWKSGKLNKTENSVWIEGVGSPFGLINPFPVSDSYLLFCSCYSDEGRDLICENEQFWEGGAPIGTHQVTINGLKYYLYPDTHDAAINYNNTWVGELNIPSEVSYDGETYAVRGMACQAFNNSTELTKVRVPKSIELVVHTILDDSDRTGAISPDYMNPFAGCTSLKSIDVDEENPIMSSVSGVLFNKDGTKLYSYPSGRNANTYTVPEGVTWIGSSAFVGNGNLVSVELPKTVEMICGGAFRWCSSIRTIDLPESAIYIGGYAFDGCTLDALVIRGIVDGRYLSSYLFHGLNESSKLYVQASEIDRYRGIFPGTIIPLEEYYTGVQAPVSLKDPSSPVYDLNGVRIKQPQKGVYIRNGKKIIKK